MTYRIATVILIILGTIFSPRAITADSFSENNKTAITKSNKTNPFMGFYIDPNPVDKLLFTNPENNSTATQSTVSVFNPCGKMIRQFTITGELANKNLNFLAPGVYYLKINNNEGASYRKVLMN